jgi:hypothetical protein
LAFAMAGKNHWMMTDLPCQSIQVKVSLLGIQPQSLKLSEACPCNLQSVFLNQFVETADHSIYFCKVSWSKSTRGETWDWPFLKQNAHPCQENLPHKSHQAGDWKVYRYDPLLKSTLRQQMLLCTKSS